MPSTRVLIHHPSEPKWSIEGELEQRAPGEPTKGRKIALILHGVLGYRNYLYQKRLARELPMDSFSFGFREATGTWLMGGLEADIKDLFAVVAYLTSDQFGYVIDLVVGHSRGSLVGLKWMCTANEGRGLRGFVNLATRHRMELTQEYLGPESCARDAASQGFYTRRDTLTPAPPTPQIEAAELDAFASRDTGFSWKDAPPNIHILSFRGLADEVVPPRDAVTIAGATSGRSPGTHTLHFIETIGHSSYGNYDETIRSILSWWGTTVENNSLVQDGLSPWVDATGSAKLMGKL